MVMGQVLQAGQGQIPSRQAQIKAGIPKEVSSETINKVCASGIRATGLLDAAIRAGDLEVGVGGGMESMSNAPYLLKQARFGFRMGDAKAIDAMIQDGLRNPFSGRQMFEEADDVAAELELTPRRHGPLGAALPRARRAGDRRGPAARGDRAGHREGQEGRHGRGDRRGPAPRELAGEARRPAAAHRRGRQPHRRQLARRQRRRWRAGGGLGRVGEAQRQARPGHHPRPGAGRRRLPLPGAHARQGRRGRARRRSASRPRTSTSGRSTRPSPRWP